MSEQELAGYRASAIWSARIDAAPTLLREDATSDAAKLDPEVARTIDARVLLLVGEDSPQSLRGGVDAVAAALPDARIEVLPGQQHLAHHTVPDRFARHVSSFLLQCEGWCGRVAGPAERP